MLKHVSIAPGSGPKTPLARTSPLLIPFDAHLTPLTRKAQFLCRTGPGWQAQQRASGGPGPRLRGLLTMSGTLPFPTMKLWPMNALEWPLF